MIVIVSNKQDYTADFLILELIGRRVDYIRFNTEDFPERVQVVWRLDGDFLDGYLVFGKTRLHFRDIHSVWYRRPVSPVPSAEILDPILREFVVAESEDALQGIWRCLDCLWVSHPDNLRQAEFKLYQLKTASRVGLRLSPTVLTNIPSVAQAFYNGQNKEVIYKTLRRGRLIRDDSVGLIYTSRVHSSEAEKLNNVMYAPSLFQKYVAKHVEIRVTIIGAKVFAVEIHSQDWHDSVHDWRRGDTARIRHTPHSLPQDVEAKCLALVRCLGLAFGAIDLILTPYGEYIFLEINPNGQWAWLQQRCPEIPLRETLADLLISGKA